MLTQYILSFCANCGLQLRGPMGQLPKEEQICENCGHSTFAREDRCEGTFSVEDGRKLLELLGDL